MNQEISGELVNTRCPEIIKILSLGRRTGRLYLNNGAETGNIFFQEGAIIHASCGSLEGEKAVYEAAVWTAGEYVRNGRHKHQFATYFQLRVPVV